MPKCCPHCPQPLRGYGTKRWALQSRVFRITTSAQGGADSTSECCPQCPHHPHPAQRWALRWTLSPHPLQSRLRRSTSQPYEEALGAPQSPLRRSPTLRPQAKGQSPPSPPSPPSALSRTLTLPTPLRGAPAQLDTCTAQSWAEGDEPPREAQSGAAPWALAPAPRPGPHTDWAPHAEPSAPGSGRGSSWPAQHGARWRARARSWASLRPWWGSWEGA